MLLLGHKIACSAFITEEEFAIALGFNIRIKTNNLIIQREKYDESGI